MVPYYCTDNCFHCYTRPNIYVILSTLTDTVTLQGADGRVVAHSPLMPATWVQLPNVVLLSLTQAVSLSGLVKYVAIDKQWASAVED